MTADAPMTASDALTPEVLARIEERVQAVRDTHEHMGNLLPSDPDYRPSWERFVNAFYDSFDDVPALLSGVRSRDARIADLEAKVAALLNISGEQERYIESLEAEVAARDAVIAEASLALEGDSVAFGTTETNL